MTIGCEPCNGYPSTNVHQLNLDWVICRVRQVITELETLEKQVDLNTSDIAKLQKDLDELINTTLPGLIDPAVSEEIQRLIDNGALGDLINTTLWDETKEEFERIIGLLEAEQRTAFSPYFHCTRGNQLPSMLHAIISPTFQHVGIVLAGDSITWGVGSTGASPTTGNTQRQDAPRNNSTSPSWANLFRKWMGSEFYPHADIAISNSKWSPSGESITTYTQNIPLRCTPSPYIAAGINSDGNIIEYTGENITAPGSTLGPIDNSSDNGIRAATIISASSYPFININNFTGNKIAFSYNLNPSEPNAAIVELFVDGTKIASVDTYEEAGGIGIVKSLEFTFVRNKQLQLRIAPADRGNLNYLLRAINIIIPKTVVIQNNAISGATWRSYYYYDLVGGYGGLNPAAVAIENTDSYCLIALGTNDRAGNLGLSASYMARALTMAKYNFCKFVIITPPDNQITPPASDSLVRDMEIGYGLETGVDIIDNWHAISNYLTEAYGKDKIHPNDFGHAILFNNVKQAILQAHV